MSAHTKLPDGKACRLAAPTVLSRSTHQRRTNVQTRRVTNSTLKAMPCKCAPSFKKHLQTSPKESASGSESRENHNWRHLLHARTKQGHCTQKNSIRGSLQCHCRSPGLLVPLPLPSPHFSIYKKIQHRQKPASRRLVHLFSKLNTQEEESNGSSTTLPLVQRVLAQLFD